jgi:hypothetical protein
MKIEGGKKSIGNFHDHPLNEETKPGYVNL